MSIQGEIAVLAELKRLATDADHFGQHIYMHPRDSHNWAANTAFVVAASPEAVLALIGKHERAADDSHRNREYFADQVERCDKLKAENTALQAAITGIECRFEVSEDTLKVIRACLRSAEGDIDRMRAENESLRAQLREAK
jgi:hypothetical protein